MQPLLPIASVMASRNSILYTLLVAALSTAQAAAPEGMGNPGTVICCKDGGRQICGDSMPSQCVGKAYRILDRSGNVIRESAPPLTAEQKEQKAAEARHRQEEEIRLRDQRRKDQALVDTYSSLDQLEKTSKRNVDSINLSIKQAEEKLAAARKRQQEWENKAKPYQGKGVPQEIQNGLRNAEAEVHSENYTLESKRRDLYATRERFETDRKRYLELTGQR